MGLKGIRKLFRRNKRLQAREYNPRLSRENFFYKRVLVKVSFNASWHRVVSLLKEKALFHRYKNLYT